MYIVKARDTRGIGDFAIVGRYQTYKGAIDKVLDLRNLMNAWGNGEYIIEQNHRIVHHFILTEDGLKEISTISIK